MYFESLCLISPLQKVWCPSTKGHLIFFFEDGKYKRSRYINFGAKFICMNKPEPFEVKGEATA